MKRYMAAFLCVLLALFTLAGCAENPMLDTIAHQDMTLTLPIDFLDLSQESFAKDADFLYGRDKLAVMGLAEKKSVLKKMTLEEYTGYVISGNKLSCTPVKTQAGYQFTYETAVDGVRYTYTSATVETAEHFWIVQCYCPSGDAAGYRDMMEEILGSLRPHSTGGN